MGDELGSLVMRHCFIVVHLPVNYRIPLSEKYTRRHRGCVMFTPKPLDPVIFIGEFGQHLKEFLSVSGRGFAATFMIVHFWRVRKDGGISGPSPMMLENEIKPLR